MRTPQTLVGVGTAGAGLVYVIGAATTSSDAGYGGVGPNFLPWVVGIALLLCGVMLVREAVSGGYRDMEEPSGAERGDWGAFVWVSAGILLNAALITTLGFILSCALAFTLAVRGFHRAEGRPQASVAQWLRDFAIGIAIAAPVYWMFTQALAINLPGLTSTGWL